MESYDLNCSIWLKIRGCFTFNFIYKDAKMCNITKQFIVYN